jgi:hypothetical protein
VQTGQSWHELAEYEKAEVCLSQAVQYKSLLHSCPQHMSGTAEELVSLLLDTHILRFETLQKLQQKVIGFNRCPTYLLA